MNSAVIFSSTSQTWQTPEYIIEVINKVFGSITLDPCTSVHNPVNAFLYCVHPDDWNSAPSKPGNCISDGLKHDWSQLISKSGLVYVNPPYKTSKEWLAKCQLTSAASPNIDVIALIPARTDTKAFHKYCFGSAAAIYFLQGRLKFSGHKNSAPFPSAFVFWGKSVPKFVNVCGYFNGHMYTPTS